MRVEGDMRRAGREAEDDAATPKRRDRLGPDFAKLWLAQGVSNLGDGVYVTALPLLAATRCRSRRSCSPSGSRGCCSACWPGRC
jgi:hypothetical protein